MRRSRHSVALAVLGMLVIVAMTSLFWSGCSRDKDTVVTPDNPPVAQSILPESNPEVGAAIGVQERVTKAFMANPNVVGTAIGMGQDGKPALLILLAEPAKDELPVKVEHLPVITEVTGVFHPVAKPGGGVSHTAKQTPPIQLGTSGGWRYDLANGYCCGGTLGSLITNGTNQYILSNTHVLAMDIVSGGNGRVAAIGDPVIQPGLIDVACNANNAQNVGTLASLASLPQSNVDAAIAQVISGMVRTDGAILEIGTISATTIAPALNMSVKKSGRTTKLTSSTISGLNASISVQYENECAGGVAFTKTFTGQILVANRSSRFLGSGDSGSLMVQNVATNPKAVGLLFAGSTSLAVANPIDQVLAYFGGNYHMVGN